MLYDFRDLNKESQDVQIEAVTRNWHRIETIRDPSPMVQIAAANQITSLNELGQDVFIYAADKITIGGRTQSIAEWMKNPWPKEVLEADYPAFIIGKFKQLLYEVVVSQRGKHELR